MWRNGPLRRVLGALFAASVVLLFLGSVRSRIIVAVAIRTSIIGTFALMKLMGYTLNTITLLALALAVGIVIDDAIVVLENIFRQIEEKGLSPREAAIADTREILVFDMALDLYALLGVFVLFGVATKNAILQIDRTNQLCVRGMPRFDAILRGSEDRLRPI